MPRDQSIIICSWDSFEQELAVLEVDIEFELRNFEYIPWADHWLNPRRLRGSDFLMRWSQGRWSEDRFVEVVEETNNYFSTPYGPSGTAPDDDPRQFELYFEHLDAAGVDSTKRPDILVFLEKDRAFINDLLKRIDEKYPLPFEPNSEVEQYSGWERLSFIREEVPEIQELLHRAVLAVECENSLWIARQMPNFGEDLRPMGRLGGKLGLPKSAKVPNIIIKDEDLGRLNNWQREANVPLHIWHAFYDLAFGISLNEATRLINEGYIDARLFNYQGPGGISEQKAIYQIHYHYAYEIGESVEEPILFSDRIIDKNGHILPYVRFEGGKLKASSQLLETLDHISQVRFG
jgi:hypothetical protein